MSKTLQDVRRVLDGRSAHERDARRVDHVDGVLEGVVDRVFVREDQVGESCPRELAEVQLDEDQAVDELEARFEQPVDLPAELASERGCR